MTKAEASHSRQQFRSCSADPIPVFPVPIDEQERLSALRDLRILDTPSNERFDRLVRLATAHFRVPVARITFVDHDRTWFKACIGMNVREAPRRVSICSHAIMDDKVLIATDLASDPRFADSPQVTGKPHFRFYAGAPLILPGGLRVGAVCLMDYQPHPDFSADSAAFLSDLAAITVHELELHRHIAERDQRLDAAGKDLKVARQVKERFLAIVSHELRTPLNAIMGFGEMIAQQKLGPVGQPSYVEYARYVCDSGRRLEGLINRVLTYSSAEATDLRLLETVVPVSPLARRCVESAATAAKKKDVTIALDVSSDAPAAVYADSVQLTEIVQELLQNAIAFSELGGTVSVRFTAHDDGGLCLRIADNGKGIPSDKLTHVMTAFSQANEDLNRSHEGIGLGLPITKALTELHGGRLKIDSKEGEGTIVEVRFPAARNRTDAGQAA